MTANEVTAQYQYASLYGCCSDLGESPRETDRVGGATLSHGVAHCWELYDLTESLVAQIIDAK